MRFRIIASATGIALALTATLVGAAGAASDNASDDVQPRIIGGKPASEDYSFYTKLLEGGKFRCGAALITPQWLATAKHCITMAHPNSVRVGGTELTSGEEIAIEKVVPGPGSDNPGPGSDFGLIKLAKPATGAPVGITSEPLDTGAAVRIMGHGLTCPTRGCGEPPQQLQELDTKLVTGCALLDPQAELCVGDQSAKGACFGDSGGPLVVKVDGRWQLGGTTSRLGGFFPVCASAPSVYNSVPHFKSWIEQHTGPLS
ncbi:trypsin [Herbihabitans rhizosphaerae]|uniref:Trypsin n=1 Tax=Herbihabitans rhizosphaerae TaxID=1872711 RepID=A0A4V2ERT7_9PSEU|nr:serine protease [Herbihabitans rhizosphaerae]RZS34007.1 trypsin [Herbihabitans rhizosphaerae]